MSGAEHGAEGSGVVSGNHRNGLYHGVAKESAPLHSNVQVGRHCRDCVHCEHYRYYTRLTI